MGPSDESGAIDRNASAACLQCDMVSGAQPCYLGFVGRHVVLLEWIATTGDNKLQSWC